MLVAETIFMRQSLIKLLMVKRYFVYSDDGGSGGGSWYPSQACSGNSLGL
jgi:hypothetical protein